MISSLVHKDDLKRVEAAIQAHLQHKTPYDIEYRIRTKSGDYKWIHSRGMAVWNDAGVATRFSGSHRDITERIENQEKLALSESRFRQMAENIEEIFWVTDALGTVPVYVSPGYTTIFGRSIESLFESPHQFFEATHPEDRDRLAKGIRAQRVAKGSSEIEYRITRPNGEIRWLWARLTSIVDAEGKVIGLCGVTGDITDEKEADIRVNEFYSTVSHELRTPLTSIRGALGLIEGGKVGDISPMALEMVRIGRVESDRLIRIINDILDVKKIEAGKFDLDKTSIEPRRLVKRTVEAIAGMASQAKVSLTSSIDSQYLVYGDNERLIQVLTNLISNAIKFSPSGSEVSVRVSSRLNDMVRFSVTDNGPGIPADKMHKLFGKFQQLDSSDSRSKGGTGLGLAISKAIVEQHDGEIGIDSEFGKGSVFWFDIPVDQRSKQSINKNTVKVLVIEPDDFWSDSLTRS